MVSIRVQEPDLERSEVERPVSVVLLATRQHAEALAAFEAAHRARPDLRLAAVRVRQARSLLQPGDAR